MGVVVKVYTYTQERETQQLRRKKKRGCTLRRKENGRDAKKGGP